MKGADQHFSLPSRANDTTQLEETAGSFILLIEDNPGDVGLILEALLSHGVVGELALVTDGEKAIEVFDEIRASNATCPDLVILDLNLPRKSGFDILQHVRDTATCQATPIVVLSSSNVDADRSRAMEMKAAGYFKKPLMLRDFLALGASLKKFL